MQIRVLKTETDYAAALKQADFLFDAQHNTPKGDELELLLLVIKEYEDKHHSVLPPDPIAALKLTMQEKGLKPKDLTGILGSKGYVSQVLNHKRPLTAEMMRILYRQFGIPAEVLLS